MNMAAAEMDRAGFERALRAGTLLLVDYWAPWCGYCRRIGPAFEMVAEEYAGRLTAARVNIDETEALAEAEGIEVIPTLVLYRDGKAAGRIVNPPSKAAIEAFIRDTLGQ